MDERITTDKIANMYSAATLHVTQINSLSGLSSITDIQKNKIQRLVEHLEAIKEFKKLDNTTSIWTTEDFTAIDAAITLGKTKYE
tara:strand:- start:361 stop:615 length:255 start_codon:yes stop_codon:yes gene_type:complete